jgi:hypothetical protein
MAKHYIEVSEEQVRAARLEVQAFRTAGLEPDPMVVRLAEAQERSTSELKAAGYAVDELAVCPVHLRFIPCRRCKGPAHPATSDPFTVEIARRYQRGELSFTLATDHDCGPHDVLDLS